MEKVKVYKRVTSTVAHSDDVESILGDYAFGVLTRSRSKLAAHHKEGRHKVTQTKGKVDHFVNLEGPGALALEQGWWTEGEPKRFVPGLNILKDSIR